MNTNVNQRLVLAFAAYLLVASLAEHSQGANIQWISNSFGSWSDASNWSPAIVPGIGDSAFVGSAIQAENTNVTVDSDVTVGALTLSDGMRISTDNATLNVAFDTLVTGANGVFHSRIEVYGSPGELEYITRDLILSNGGQLDMINGGTVRVNGRLHTQSDALVRAQGVIDFYGNSGDVFDNDGLLDARPGGITLRQQGDGLFDLDGNTGNGEIDLTGIFFQFASLEVLGTELSDSFSGTISMITGATLDMDLDTSWTADANSELNLLGWSDMADPARILGSAVTLGGAINVMTDSAAGRGRFEVEATLQNSVVVSLEAENELEFQNMTVIEGGDYTLAEDAEIHFNGETLIEGGTFSTFSNLASDGLVRFNGPTEWSGVVVFNGNARQNGDATVGGATTITAGVFDMDGGGATAWSLGGDLTVNADSVDSTISDSFDGTFNIGGGFFPELTINLTDPTDHWTMAGEMNLSGLAALPFPISRVAGSHMRLTGDLNVTNSVTINAPATFDNGSTTTLANPATRLHLNDPSTVRPNATFVGQGTLVNNSTEGLTLEDGVSLDQTGLVNGGLLEVGDSPGFAAVDRFENTADGTWLVEIGGHVAGSEFDLLLVALGATELDGLIEVDLIDAGTGLFLPQIGDEFTVLTSFGGVNGTFQNEPVSFAAGQSYHWEVLYNPNDVTLKLVDINIVPEPGTIMLLASPILALAFRKRSTQ